MLLSFAALNRMQLYGAADQGKVDTSDNIRVLFWRVRMLEDQVKELTRNHEAIIWLLVGNLAAVTGSLVTYILTHRRGRRQGLG
jgi:hypothetical protein